MTYDNNYNYLSIASIILINDARIPIIQYKIVIQVLVLVVPFFLGL